MVKCPNCESESPDGSQFCCTCGLALKKGVDTNQQRTTNGKIIRNPLIMILIILAIIVLILIIVMIAMNIYHSEFEKYSSEVEITVQNTGYMKVYDYLLYVDDELVKKESIGYTSGTVEKRVVKQQVEWDKDLLTKTVTVKLLYKQTKDSSYKTMTKTVTLSNGIPGTAVFSLS